MKVIYNTTTDVLRIVFRDAPVEDFSEDRPEMKVDYDAEDQIIALEIKNASALVENPKAIEHFVVEN